MQRLNFGRGQCLALRWAIEVYDRLLSNQPEANRSPWSRHRKAAAITNDFGLRTFASGRQQRVAMRSQRMLRRERKAPDPVKAKMDMENPQGFSTWIEGGEKVLAVGGCSKESATIYQCGPAAEPPLRR
jgi:hypothetical protein